MRILLSLPSLPSNLFSFAFGSLEHVLAIGALDLMLDRSTHFCIRMRVKCNEMREKWPSTRQRKRCVIADHTKKHGKRHAHNNSGRMSRLVLLLLRLLPLLLVFRVLSNWKREYTPSRRSFDSHWVSQSLLGVPHTHQCVRINRRHLCLPCDGSNLCSYFRATKISYYRTPDDDSDIGFETVRGDCDGVRSANHAKCLRQSEIIFP